MRPQLNPLILGPGAPWSLPGSSLDLQFTTGRAAVNRQKSSISSLLTTTRASTGYAQTSTGSLTLFPANTPRITDLGLLVEQAATNLVLNSVGFGTGWAGSLAGTGSTGVGTAASGTAPDGTNTAVRLQLALNGGTTASDRSLWTQSITVSNATAYTNSLYFKSNTASTYVVQIGTPDGSAVAVTVTPTAWTRVQTTATTSSTTMTYQVRLRGGQTPTNSDSADILISGAQTELGSFATSYIPTTTVAVTRAADVITFNNLSLPAPYSMFFSAGSSAKDTGDMLLGGTSNDGSLLRLSGGGGVANVIEGGVTTASVTSGSMTINTPFKMAGRFAVNDTNLSMGGAIGTHDTSTIPPTLTALGFGRALYGFGSPIGSVYFTRTALFRFGLGDSQLQALTT